MQNPQMLQHILSHRQHARMPRCGPGRRRPWRVPRHRLAALPIDRHQCLHSRHHLRGVFGGEGDGSVDVRPGVARVGDLEHVVGQPDHFFLGFGGAGALEIGCAGAGVGHGVCTVASGLAAGDGAGGAAEGSVSRALARVGAGGAEGGFVSWVLAGVGAG